jgi:hypothetical protein
MSAGEDFGGWTPAAGESPAEREKRLKREKRAAMLAAAGGQGPASSNALPTASTSNSYAAAGAPRENYGGWQPAPGETPAEREKRMKREKRQAMLAAQNGAGASSSSSYGAGPQPPPITSQRAEGESYDGWTPLAGESPAEREKRIKREKRAAMLAASANAAGHAVPSAYFPPPPELGGTGASYAGSAVGQSEGAPGSEAGGDKKSKHAQSLTPARLRYLKRKKQTRKAKVKAAPKNKSTAAEGEEASAAAVAGTKRQRDEDDDGEDGQSSGEESDAEGGASEGAKKARQATAAASEAAAAAAKWPELSEAERQAKLEMIAKKKAERREQRLAKKAELKRIKAEGGVVPPPKPRVVETTKRRTNADPETTTTTKVVEPPVEPEPEQPAEPTEEEIEEQKRQEELAARKALKALKKQQRRQPKEADAVEEDAEMADGGVDAAAPTLIPTAHVPNGDAEASKDSPAEAEAEKAPAEPAVLHRLPGATRPAPPSAKTLSALNVHEQVRDKQVVDPTTNVKIAEEVGADGTGVSEKGRKRLRNDMGVEEWFAGAPPPS